MSQAGYTPILIYGSATAAAVPTAGNLTSSANGAELALNYTDGKLYYKDNGGTVRLLTDKISVSVASANGFAGTVAQATATSTPAITLTTSVNGIIYGNGTSMQAVTIGTGVSFVGGTLTATGTGGTVTAISVTSANGFAGTSSGGATPALTLTTTVTASVLKGNGTSILAAVAGTDYAPPTSGTSILYGNGSGGFSNVTVGSNLTFIGGTLSASGGGSWTVITTTTTASSGSAYLVDTSAGSYTVSLPASPSTGAAVTFSDRSYTWDQYPVTIGRNGSTIEGLSEDMICSIQEASFTLVYDGSTWRLV